MLPIAYYNEHDPKAAAWLRELINGGLIAYGFVDERSIEDVRPDELIGYTQCHFFAGIGGWSLALRLAGWPDDRPVWTGSCPCQPFSAAGKGDGFADERHLWPAWFHLIGQCNPDVVFGEQVEAAIRHGWLDLVQADMEGLGYAFAAAGLPAASVGAPHIRQRLWFVADRLMGDSNCEQTYTAEQGQQMLGKGCTYDIVADSDSGEQGGRCGETGGEGKEVRIRSSVDANNGGESDQQANSERTELPGNNSQERWIVGRGTIGELGNAIQSDGSRLGQVGIQVEPEQEPGRPGYADHWADTEFIRCADGKSRPVEPTIFPLAHGIPGRVGLLRGAGNAIVPEVAQAFIEGYMTCSL